MEIIEFWVALKQKSCYFKDIWNIMDFTGCLCQIISLLLDFYMTYNNVTNDLRLAL